MAWVRSFHMTYRSNHFNANEKVFIVYMTGNQAAYCYGRYRGKHRYVKAWVQWDSANKPFPKMQEFEIDDASGIAKVCGSSVPLFEPTVDEQDKHE